MTWMTLRYRLARMAAPLLLIIAGTSLVSCGLLDVSDPTAILDEDLNNAQNAELLRRGVLAELSSAVGGAAWQSGLFADEFLYQPNASFDGSPILAGDELLDRRMTAEHYEQQAGATIFNSFQRLRIQQASVALVKLQTHAVPGAREAHTGEMFAVRGYATMRLAEDFCPGFPLPQLVGYEFVLSPPLTTEQVFASALADFDSAVSWAADSARVLNFARIARGRTMLNLGRFAEAASSVTQVPTSYVYRTQYGSVTTNELAIGNFFRWSRERSVADQEGGNGLDFVSAKDPRVDTDSLGTARDGVTGLYGIGKYPNPAAQIVLASGLEALLIEAEAALNAGDPTWLTVLNDLRANQISPPLAALTDPGTQASRVDLLFRERAFWLFATGTRLGDLRRLVRVYGRPSESVFPTGAFWRGGVYGAGTSLPFNKQEATFSPGVTGCTSF